MKKSAIFSKIKISSAYKTEQSSSKKKNHVIKHIINSEPHLVIRQDSPILFELAKSIPKNIIYDKQTLYIEVQQLRKIINKITTANMKLRTRIAVLQKDKLNKSRDWEESNDKSFHLTQLFRSSFHLKNDKLDTLKKQIKQLRFQLEAQKEQNQRIKQAIGFTIINEIQQQNKALIEENKYLQSINQQAKAKTVSQISSQKQCEDLKSKIFKLAKQNQVYICQIQNLKNQISILKAQLIKGKSQKNSRQAGIKNEIAEDKKVAMKLKEILGYRRQNPSMPESKVRSIKSEEKLQQTLFKDHHVQPQPIRKNTILADDSIPKSEQQFIYQFQLQMKAQAQFINQNEKLKQKIGRTNRRLRQMQEKSAKEEHIDQIQTMPFAVHTYSAKNLERAKAIKQNQVLLQGSPHQQSRQKAQEYNSAKFKQQSDNQSPPIIQFNSHIKRSYSEKHLQQKQSEEPQHQAHRIKTQYLKQKVNLNVPARKKSNKQTLIQIIELLTYRFKYQRYRFVDLKKDIESSKVIFFSYIDVCHMLVNEPFYLKTHFCRVLAFFIFEKQKLKSQDMLQTVQLLIKLRKIIKDYPELTSQKELDLLEKCTQKVKRYEKYMIKEFQIRKNQDNTIQILKLQEILAKFGFGREEIEYMITQVSINSSDLQHIPYELILERFTMTQSVKSSKSQVIFQKGQEESSYLNEPQPPSTSSLGSNKKRQIKRQKAKQFYENSIKNQQEGSVKIYDAHQGEIHHDFNSNAAFLTENVPKK